MGSPFKMNPKTPFMKALVGKQGNLPQHLQDAIKAAPAKSTKKPMTAEEIKKNKEILDYRRGKGRIKESGGDINARGINKGRGLEGEAKVAGSAGTRGVKEDYTASGKSMGTSGRVVKEKTASQIKARGIDTGKKKSKGKSPAKSYGKSPAKMTGGSKGKRKLGTEGMSYKEKVAYYEKQKKAKPAKNPKIRMGMGTSYTTIKK